MHKMAALVETSRELSPPPVTGREDEGQEREESGEDNDREEEVKSKEPVDSTKAAREERMKKLRDLHKRRVSNYRQEKCETCAVFRQSREH